MRILAGIFDLGKVVVHSDDDVLLSEVRKELDLDDKSVKQIAIDLGDEIGTGKISEEEYLKQIDKNVTPDLFKRSFERDFKFIQETIEVIKKLRERKIKLASLSNTIPNHVDVMSANGVFENFEINILSCEVGLRKPDIRIFKLTLDRLGVEPGQTFFVDDKEENIRAAEELGIRAILFQNPDQLKAKLSELGLVV